MEKVKLEFQGQVDSLVCVCGNTACCSGFETCNINGEVVEPVVGKWVDDTILCNACFRIISQSALAVVGKK